MLINILIFLLIIPSICFGQISKSYIQTVSDGSTTCNPTELIFSSITSCTNRVATIANGGGGGSPGTPDNSFQYRLNGTTFAGSVNFLHDDTGGTSTYVTKIGDMDRTADIGTHIALNVRGNQAGNSVGAVFENDNNGDPSIMLGSYNGFGGARNSYAFLISRHTGPGALQSTASYPFTFEQGGGGQGNLAALGLTLNKGAVNPTTDYAFDSTGGMLTDGINDGIVNTTGTLELGDINSVYNNTNLTIDSGVGNFTFTQGNVIIGNISGNLNLPNLTASRVLATDSGKNVVSIAVAPSGAFVGDTDTQTLTNKLIVPRVTTAADATSITPNTDNEDVTYQLNTQATGTLTINANGGTCKNGKGWLLKIKSTNVQTFSWNSYYVGGAIPLPTATTGGGKIDSFSFICDTVNTKEESTGTAMGF